MNKSLEQLLADGALTLEQKEAQRKLGISILDFAVGNNDETLHIPGVGEVTVSVTVKTGGLPNDVMDDGATDYLLTVDAPEDGGHVFTVSDNPYEGPVLNEFFDPRNPLDFKQRPVATVVDRDSVAALTQFVVTQ